MKFTWKPYDPDNPILDPAIVYDVETYPNVFTLYVEDLWTGAYGTFEISNRRNDIAALINWLADLRARNVPMIGFNNVSFDYYVLHHIMMNPGDMTPQAIYEIAMRVIKSYDRFETMIWPSDRMIPQIDLFTIHHFNNRARTTSLKALQFAMRSESVEDLPFPPGTVLSDDQIDTLIHYNGHDVQETKKFALLSMANIEFRLSLVDQLGPDVVNYDDTKIGKKYFANKLGDDLCYERINGKRQPRQTPREVIHLRDIIFPYITFKRPEFQRVLEWLKAQSIHETKSVFTDLHAVIDGFSFDFSTGGLHASVRGQTFRTSDTYEIVDLDVTSFYPSIAIANQLSPEHLGQPFVHAYQQLKTERLSHAKGTPMNAALKLALNGVYGDSNQPFSVFYDPQYTMSITMNGQLLLCMLSEMLIDAIPGLQMIQGNTDGITVYLPRAHRQTFEHVKEQWERFTCLDLEEVIYTKMFIKDVNNYRAVDTDGNIKRKNAFNSFPTQKDYDGQWHKDHSALIIPEAAGHALDYGVSVRDFINAADDPFDFMLRYKTPGGSKLFIGDVEQQKTLRYYVSIDGEPLYKISPPAAGNIVGEYKRKNKIDYRYYLDVLREIAPGTWDERIHTKNKSRYEIRKTGVLAGWSVSECNRADRFDWSKLNRQYYIDEADKLVKSVSG